MPLRNGEHGYGAVTKILHGLTFSLIVAQFVVVGLHIALVLKHTIIPQDRHLARML